MDRSGVLRIVVACGCILITLACVVASTILELQERPTPPFVAGLGGTALGLCAAILSGMTAPPPASPPAPPPAPPPPLIVTK